jgi:hypothetical protein
MMKDIVQIYRCARGTFRSTIFESSRCSEGKVRWQVDYLIVSLGAWYELAHASQCMTFDSSRISLAIQLEWSMYKDPLPEQ